MKAKLKKRERKRDLSARRVNNIEKEMGKLVEHVNGSAEHIKAISEAVSKHLGTLYRNEKGLADMIFTVSVRNSVMRRIAREKLGIDDVAFEALADQEVAKRREEEAAAREAAAKEAQEKTATEKAKELGRKVAADHESTMEDLEFGGDYGEEREAVSEEESGCCGSSAEGTACECEGAVEGAGCDNS
jgi:hypothetical protein